ncbi:MAG TPA: MarR family transcriptional regulator [Chloroflexota bacterium]|nr:MarR family transcriptional regulator [Chloroflexota bacterium]
MTQDTSDSVRIADLLHSAAIHLLRRVSRHDAASGLSAARLSALSVIVYADRVTMSELAQAEGVRLPTISRLVDGLERDGLVLRQTDPSDRRVVHLTATESGRHLLEEARQRRIGDLAARIECLPAEEQATLAAAAEILDGLGK